MTKFYVKKGIYHICPRYTGLRCTYKIKGDLIVCLDCDIKFPIFLILGIKEIYRLDSFIAVGYIYADLKLDNSFKELNI